jgi:RNA polymerase sigma-70 factor (ECF subfamily)
MDSAYDLVTALVRTERFRLAAVARREGLAPEDAVDCVHDAFCTFLRLAQRDEVPTAPAELPAFLTGIVRNEARNARRRHHRARPHDDLDALAAVSPEAAADAMLERAEDHVRLRACVERLCDTQKAVVTMRMLEEHAGEDVARSLNVTRGYVDVLLHRAKASLFACLTE